MIVLWKYNKTYYSRFHLPAMQILLSSAYVWTQEQLEDEHSEEET